MPFSTKPAEPREPERDLPLLLLRTVLGGVVLTHGLRHARTIEGTSGWFASIGFRRPRLQAHASAVTEMGAGAASILGLATPAAAAAIVGTMGVAARSVHARNGFFITDDGYEYVLTLSVAALALAGLGPGRVSLDRLLGLERLVTGSRGVASALVVGGAAAAAQLAVFYRDPAASQRSTSPQRSARVTPSSTPESTR